MRELAKEHIVIEVVKQFWEQVFHGLSQLPKQWNKWGKFKSEFTSARSAKDRENLLAKFGVIQQLGLVPDPSLLTANILDYLTMLYLPQTPLESKCALCNRKNAMKTYINKPNGFEEMWVCVNEQCFQAFLAEDKIPPLRTAHINTGEIRSNILKLFEPFMTTDELVVSNKKGGLPHSTDSQLWKDLVLTFDIDVFSESFIRAKSTYIFQLYKRMVLDSHPDASNSLSTRDELKALLALPEFKQAVASSYEPVTEVNSMELIKELVAYDPTLTKEFLVSKLVEAGATPEERELLSQNLPIQLFHYLIAQGFKKGGTTASFLPQELLNKRLNLLPPLCEFFAEPKLEQLVDNEKFSEALRNVLVMPVFTPEPEEIPEL